MSRSAVQISHRPPSIQEAISSVGSSTLRRASMEKNATQRCRSADNVEVGCSKRVLSLPKDQPSPAIRLRNLHRQGASPRQVIFRYEIARCRGVVRGRSRAVQEAISSVGSSTLRRASMEKCAISYHCHSIHIVDVFVSLVEIGGVCT